jgi:parallel beta-helix repeat protein
MMFICLLPWLLISPSAEMTVSKDNSSGATDPIYTIWLPIILDPSIYYVDGTLGSNANPGSSTHPWKTIQKCLNVVLPGDTCRIRAGTYNEGLILKTSGASGTPITIQNYPGEIVTVNSGGSMTLQTSGHQSYYTIDGLRFISTISGDEVYTIDLSIGWPYNETVTTGGNGNIILKNCYIEGAILLYGPNNTVQNCEFNGRNAVGDAIRSYLAASQNTLIKNNIIHDYTSRAVWINVIADNAYVVGNTIYNTYLGIDCDGAGRPVTNCHVLGNKVFNTGGGFNHTEWGCSIFLEDAFNAVVDGNMIYNASNGAGIYVINYGIGTDHNTDTGIEYRGMDLNAVISNNVIYSNGDGAVLDHAASGIQFFNNTVSNSTPMMSLIGDTSSAGMTYYPQHWTVINNIFVGSGSTAAWLIQDSKSITSSTFSNNLYWKSRNNTGGAITSADPKFVGAPNYHLQIGSPAIDSGYNLGSLLTKDFDGVTRPQGSGYDVGAYEFESLPGAFNTTPYDYAGVARWIRRIRKTTGHWFVLDSEAGLFTSAFGLP